MSSHSGGQGNDTLPLKHEIVTVLEADAVHLAYDDKFLYAACRDQMIRVWSKGDWQQVAVLGETDSAPLAVHVDEEQIYATCEKRVYVWRKDAFGMIGWFELSYSAITSTLQDDRFYVGSRDGRLVSIKKDTHDTSSWQLHKTDLTTLWSDKEIICTATKKEEPVVWKRDEGSAPTELARLDKDKDVVLTGNDSFIIVGLSTGSIKVWNRAEWKLEKTLEPRQNGAIASMWSINPYLLVASQQSYLTIWDLRKDLEVGQIEMDGAKFVWAEADHDYIFAASSEGIVIARITTAEGRAVDLCSRDSVEYTGTIRVSPYDVLEEVLVLQRKGDDFFEDENYPEAVAHFERAQELLIDNHHGLMEVPEERERLTSELSMRHGRALLRAKLEELDKLKKEVEAVSSGFDSKSQSTTVDEEIVQLWATVTRTIKESRVLADAEAENILSYQLAQVAESLESELKIAKKKLGKYLEKVSQAISLTHSISSEWRWMERRKTTLEERKAFLERVMDQLEERLKSAEGDIEVEEVLTSALDEYKQLHSQIDRILSASSEPSEAEAIVSKDEAVETIKIFLQVLPKKQKAILAMSSKEEKRTEAGKLLEALEQAAKTAERYKLKDMVKKIAGFLASVTAIVEECSKVEEESSAD